MRTHHSSDIARRFLATYLTSGQARAKFVSRLALEEWRPVFVHLATSADVPEDVRVELVDAALRATTATSINAFDAPSEVAAFLLSNYQQMSAYTDPSDAESADAAVALLLKAGARLPDLADLDDGVLDRVVRADLYEISAANIRLAARISDSVDLDRLLNAAPKSVHRYCLQNLEQYMHEVAGDDATGAAITEPATLAKVLNTDEATDWSSEQQRMLFAAAANTAALSSLPTVPSTMWEALAEARLFQATANNVAAYVEDIGSIDASLAELLTSAGTFTPDVSDSGGDAETEEGSDPAAPADKRKLVVLVLNARSAIPSPEIRVQLATSLGPDTPLTATEVAPENTDLFARLLRSELVPDDADTFAHLANGGSDAVKTAIAASAHVASFLAPVHVSGVVGDVLADQEAADKVGQLILRDLDSFVPDADRRAWTQVAEFALRTRTPLPWPHLQRVAANSTGPARQTMELLDVRDSQPTDVEEVLAVLSHLEKPWCYPATRDLTKFDVPDDPPGIAVLQFLEKQGLVKVNRPKRNGKRSVTLL